MRAVAETGSTNADLLSEAAAGAPDRSVLRADHQSAGRGRLDRTWEAPPGSNLLVSFLFRQVPDHPFTLTRVVALAALRVARDRCGVEAALKWPNDVLVAGEKAGGILAQSGPSRPDGRPDFVVVGLGLNLRWSPPGATSLSEQGWSAPIGAHDFCLAMLPVIDEMLSSGEERVNEEYLSRVATIGARVRVILPGGGEIMGRAMTVETDGRLVVVDDCAVSHRFDTADIMHLRPDGA